MDKENVTTRVVIGLFGIAACIAVTIISTKISVDHCDRKNPVVKKVVPRLKVGDLVTHKLDNWPGIVIRQAKNSVSVRIEASQYAYLKKHGYGIAPIFSGLAAEWEKRKRR